MYTANPPTPTPALSTWPRQATLRPPWWTIPEADRLQMHAFTLPSHQLRQKIRAVTLRSLHHSSLYMRLILQAKTHVINTAITGTTLHTRVRVNAKEGSYILKFIYGQLYYGKLAKRYGHTPTDECPLCHLPDSCTHIASECKSHKTYPSTVITRRAGSYMRQSGSPQKEEAHSMPRRTFVLSHHTRATNPKPPKRPWLLS